MYIEYNCSGGFGGLRLAYKGETDDLPDGEAKMLLDLIEAANVFENLMGPLPWRDVRSREGRRRLSSPSTYAR